MNRTTLYILLFIIFVLLLSMIEPSVKIAVLVTAIITLLKYLNTFVHELGHCLAGKLMGYPVKAVIIGQRKQFWSISVCGTLFVFCYGFGGLTLIESGNKVSKLRHSIFALGGVVFQLVVISLIYLTFGIGNEGNFYLPLVFMVLNVWTIIVNLYPSIIVRYGEIYLSDGLLLKRILLGKEIH